MMKDILRYFAQKKMVLSLYLLSVITVTTVAPIVSLSWVTSVLLFTSLSLTAHAVHNVIRAFFVDEPNPAGRAEPDDADIREAMHNINQIANLQRNIENRPNDFVAPWRALNLNRAPLHAINYDAPRHEIYRGGGLNIPDRQNLEPDRLGDGVAYNESAMRALEPGEMKVLNEIRARYKQSLKAVGQENVFEAMRDYLRDQYEKNPVKDPSNQDFVYPLEYVENIDYSENVRELYYKNVWHTAYRYLFWIPNPFIANDARYVRDVEGGRCADIHNKDQTLIAYMWLMAMDETIALPELFESRGQVKEQVATLLAQCGRGHNWDNSRLIQRKNRQDEFENHNEYYDDMNGDKPTCARGVPRNVVQCYSLFYRVLDVDALSNKFKSMALAQGNKNALHTKIEGLNQERREIFFGGVDDLAVGLYDWDDFEEDNSEACQLLKALVPDDNFIETCIADCRAHFGTKHFDAEDTKIVYQDKTYGTYEALIKHWQKNFYECFSADIRQLKNHFLQDKQSSAFEAGYFPGSDDARADIDNRVIVERDDVPPVSDRNRAPSPQR